MEDNFFRMPMTTPDDKVPAIPSAQPSQRCAKLLAAANAQANLGDEVIDLVIERRLRTDRATHFPELDSLMQRLTSKEPK